MKSFKLLYVALISTFILGCGNPTTVNEEKKPKKKVVEHNEDKFAYETEQFADLRILRYKIDGFKKLKKRQKVLAYYLYEAALSGRDITWDQNFKYNLCIRRTLEAVVNSYDGDMNTEDYRKFMVYTKRVWFSNGIHHHYATQKLIPNFVKKFLLNKRSEEYTS